MRVCVFQPKYPAAGQEAACFEEILSLLDACTPRDDLIVLPEYSNAPGISEAGELRQFCADATPRLLARVRETALRCGAYISFNGAFGQNGRLRNTTVLFAPDGSELGSYEKIHPTAAETGSDGLGLDGSYDKHPVVVEADGVRFGFLTCYDIYFGELLESIAATKPDVILFPSYQRRETREITELQTRLLAHKANAFVLRSSLGMGQGCETGGNSMICSPEGTMIACMGQECGLLRADIEPRHKRTKPQNPGLQWLLHRAPKAYLPAGASVTSAEDQMPYPRLCAHRGFNTVAPENTLPAFAAAVACGAKEIEFDVRVTADGALVVCHDPTLDRTTDRSGRISELSAETVRSADAGVRFSPQYAGTRIPLAEEVLAMFAGRVIMNIHVNIDLTGADFERAFRRLVSLIDRYGCGPYCYLAGGAEVLEAALKFAPKLSRCCLAGQTDGTLIANAVRYRCQRAQLFKPYFDDAMIAEAKNNGIRLNVFWSDDPAETAELLRRGIDTVLTNDYLAAARALHPVRLQ